MSKKLYYLFFMIIPFVSCKKEMKVKTIIIGHAGNGLNTSTSLYHDNSKEAIELAISYEGCDGVEIDVQQSKDGSLWLYHDVNLSSKTNVKSCINSLNYNTLNTVYYKTVLKEKLCSLIEISTLNLTNKFIFLDLRHFNECENKMLNISTFIQKIKEFQAKNPSAKIISMTNNETWVDSLFSNGLNTYFSAETLSIAAKIPLDKVNGFMFKNHEIEKQDVEKYQKLNKKIVIFEVRSPKGIRNALKKDADFLVTDDIRTTLIEKFP